MLPRHSTTPPGARSIRTRHLESTSATTRKRRLAGFVPAPASAFPALPPSVWGGGGATGTLYILRLVCSEYHIPRHARLRSTSPNPRSSSHSRVAPVTTAGTPASAGTVLAPPSCRATLSTARDRS